MKYVELIARVAPDYVERTSDLLRELAGAGTWVERPFEQPDLESDAVVDARGAALVHAYARDDRRDGIVQRAADALIGAGIVAQVTSRTVDEQDWAESWKEHFHVERFGERIVVVPSWREYDARDGDVVLTLDPGMAFGTGQHETTRMCLEALERALAPGMRVLDAGCGSGILAIAAAKLGAAEVFAFDIDPECVRITDENAAANGVGAVVRAVAGAAGGAWPFDTPATAFDIVVANIIARVIIDVAPALVGALAPGGRLIVSGVIAERESETVAALTAAGARVESARAMGDWRCIESVRT